MHYTWGAVFNLPNGTKEWEFDKRYYTEPEHEQKARAVLAHPTWSPNHPVVLHHAHAAARPELAGPLGCMRR